MAALSLLANGDFFIIRIICEIKIILESLKSDSALSNYNGWSTTESAVIWLKIIIDGDRIKEYRP